MISISEITVYIGLNFIWHWLYPISVHNALQMCGASLLVISYYPHSFKRRRQGYRKREEKKKEEKIVILLVWHRKITLTI